MALILSLVGALTSLALAAVTLTGAAPFCPLCALVQIINLALVLPLKRLSGRSIGQLLRALAGGCAYLLGGSSNDPVAARWKLVGLLAAGLVAVALYQWVLIEVTLRGGPGQRPFNPRDALAEFESVPKYDILVDSEDPQLGPAGAPAQLVVFSDFQCPACGRFAARMTDLVERFDGKLRIIFKHHPLGNACNDSIKRDLHPRACEAAWAAEAARRQGKFWAFHDARFAAHLDDNQSTLVSIAQAVGLDLERFDAERRDESVKAKIASDVELGNRLGVDATPSFYLNGRRVFDTRARTMQFLVAHEIEHTNH